MSLILVRLTYSDLTKFFGVDSLIVNQKNNRKIKLVNYNFIKEIIVGL
jgi:hypothetical protein